VALQFVVAATQQRSLAPCYHANDTLVGSLWRTLCAPPLLAVVRYGQPQNTLGLHRRACAQQVQTAIAESLA
jgi:1-acyl-sn-glycerol-3-phosphate acyltransferase